MCGCLECLKYKGCPTSDLDELLDAAKEFRDFLGDGDNGPPSYMLLHFQNFEAAIDRYTARSEKET